MNIVKRDIEVFPLSHGFLLEFYNGKCTLHSSDDISLNEEINDDFWESALPALLGIDKDKFSEIVKMVRSKK